MQYGLEGEKWAFLMKTQRTSSHSRFDRGKHPLLSLLGVAGHTAHRFWQWWSVQKAVHTWFATFNSDTAFAVASEITTIAHHNCTCLQISMYSHKLSSHHPKWLKSSLVSCVYRTDWSCMGYTLYLVQAKGLSAIYCQLLAQTKAKPEWNAINSIDISITQHSFSRY